MLSKRSITTLASVGLFGLLAVSSVQAATAEQRQIQVLAGACSNCHGTEGRLAGAIPAIAGRPAGVLESQLLSFKRGEQPHATVMDRLAKGYTDAELAALAEYFATIDKQ